MVGNVKPMAIKVTRKPDGTYKVQTRRRQTTKPTLTEAVTWAEEQQEDKE